MNPRVRNLELKAVKEVSEMSETDCIELLERTLSFYRWLVFPHDTNPSVSKTPKTKKVKAIRTAAKMAIASQLRALAIRLQNEYEKEL